MVAILVEDLIGDLGCEVVGPISTAAEAKAMAEAGGFDFALLDVNLGNGETSFEAAEILRRRAVPFAFVTGYGAQGVRADLRDAPVIHKPIDPEVLKRFLQG